MSYYSKIALPFLEKKKKAVVPVTLIRERDFKSWLKKAPESLRQHSAHINFSIDGKKTLLTFNEKGRIEKVYTIVKNNIALYDLASCAADIKSALSDDLLKECCFTLEAKGFSDDDLVNAITGWGLAGYAFDRYKAKKKPGAMLHVGKNKTAQRAQNQLKALFLLRDLINTPANDMGPADLEAAARDVAKTLKAKVSVIKDKQLLDKNFPAVYTVGEAAGKERRPRLIELNWGKKSDPKVTIVGKGVCFDTGGLNLKPGQYMRDMKKDMGGAAHALGLASMIIAQGLPVQLKVIIPAVENAVGGDAFRPGDILKSRKGLFIENTNTDAEGRLILADGLTYACEDEPELVIDFATLTGSARAALGQEIPAMFSTKDKTAKDLQKASMDAEDPLWHMPLWQDYKRHIQNSTGDLVNSVGVPGDLIYSALFLQQFITDTQEWIHLDCFAWEASGRPGRPKGGMDSGMRAVFAYLEKRYGG